MAKSISKPDNGFQFIFNADELKAVCEGEKKVVISCFLVPAVTKDGRKVGAMEVWAEGIGGAKKSKKLKMEGTGGVSGCPCPPCQV